MSYIQYTIQIVLHALHIVYVHATYSIYNRTDYKLRATPSVYNKHNNNLCYILYTVCVAHSTVTLKNSYVNHMPYCNNVLC